MGQMNTQNNQFNNAAFSPGSPFPFPASASGPTSSSYPATSQPSVTVDVPATKVEAAPTTDVKDENVKKEPKKMGKK